MNQKSWTHGAENCNNNKDPAIDILQFNEATFVLRQNKCVHYEAPFIYVLFGEHTVFLQDTGATAEADKFPLYEMLQTLIAHWQKSHHAKDVSLLINHSHSHSDHTAADSQFRDKSGVILIEPNAQSVHQYFNFIDWPNEITSIDLGERELTIIPIPGHQEEISSPSVTVEPARHTLLWGSAWQLVRRGWPLDLSRHLLSCMNYLRLVTINAFFACKNKHCCL